MDKLDDILTPEDKTKLKNHFSKDDKKLIKILQKHRKSLLKYERIANTTKNSRISRKNHKKISLVKKAQQKLFKRLEVGLDYIFNNYLETVLERQFFKFAHVKDITLSDRVSNEVDKN